MQNTFNSNTAAPLRTTSRFDSLKSNNDNRGANYRNQSNFHKNFSRPHYTPKQPSSASLFSVGNNSLSDYISKADDSTTEKYVSPAMRWREQKSKKNRSSRRTNFYEPEEPKKPSLDISGTSFPSINGTTKKPIDDEKCKTSKYAKAAAMDNEEYNMKKKEQAAKENVETTYVSTTDTVKETTHDEEYIDPKKPVCTYAAAVAAMSMLRCNQHKRDEQNEVFGAQSPYWGMKSLLDFDIDSDDDSNYAESSEDEKESIEEYDDDY